MVVELAHMDTPHGRWKLFGYQHVSKPVWVANWHSPTGSRVWEEIEIRPGVLKLHLIETLTTLLEQLRLKQI